MSAHFLTPLQLEEVSTPDDLRIRLLLDFEFYSDILGGVGVVKRDLTSDGRSTPRLIWNIEPPTGAILWAAIPHDQFYTLAGTWMKSDSGELVFISISRATADAVYRELMLAKGFTRFAAWQDWFWLRLRGGSRWNAHRKEAAQ